MKTIEIYDVKVIINNVYKYAMQGSTMDYMVL